MIEIVLRILYHVAAGTAKKVKINKDLKCVDVDFRCWPVDIDIFFHMNNAKYIRVAELARWHITPATGILTARERHLFLAVEQRIQYFKPIAPFQKYTVRTTLSYSPDDNKWLHYNHAFIQHRSDVKENQEPIKYAEIQLKVRFA